MGENPRYLRKWNYHAFCLRYAYNCNSEVQTNHLTVGVQAYEGAVVGVLKNIVLD